MVGHDGWMLGGGHVMVLWLLLPVAFVVALFIYFLSPSGGTDPQRQPRAPRSVARYAGR